MRAGGRLVRRYQGQDSSGSGRTGGSKNNVDNIGILGARNGFERVGRMPEADEQDGYVPNVVYSCGAPVHNGILVIPYGVADTAIGLARVEVRRLLDAMTFGPSDRGE